MMFALCVPNYDIMFINTTKQISVAYCNFKNTKLKRNDKDRYKNWLLFKDYCMGHTFYVRTLYLRFANGYKISFYYNLNRSLSKLAYPSVNQQLTFHYLKVNYRTVKFFKNLNSDLELLVKS